MGRVEIATLWVGGHTKTLDNNDINQVGVQRFWKKQRIGWGALSRGLVNPGLGHCHLRILLWVGRKAPFDLLFPNSSLLEFQQGTRFREQKHSRTRRKLSILLRFYFHGVLEQLKTNFQTNFRFKRVLGFVIEYA